MRVLVTGISGFIGKQLLKQLLKEDVQLIVSSSGKSNIEPDVLALVDYRAFDISKTAEFIGSGSSLMDYFGKPEKVVHLAWRNSSQHQLAAHISDELPSQYLFLSQFIKEGLSDLTVTGTSFEYGDLHGEAREDALVRPNTNYGLAKYTLFLALEMLQKEKEFRLKWVRLFNIFGKGTQDNTLLAQLTRAVKSGEQVFNMSGGEQVRDFLPVEQAAKYLASIALQNDINGIINCCSAEPQRLIDFVKNFLQKNNYNIKLNTGYYPYRDYEPMESWGNNEKLARIVNMNQAVSPMP